MEPDVTAGSTGDADLTEPWARAVASLTESSLTPQQRAFVSLTRPLGLVEGTALIAAPNDFTKDVLETRLRPLVTAALTAELGHEVRLAVTVDPTITESVTETTVDVVADATYPDSAKVETSVEAPDFVTGADRDARPGTGAPSSSTSEGRLNDKYTFDTFVIGSSNRFAHAAAVAVAEAPAKAYNPLFVYGGSGLGKTHLLHAIGHYARTLFKGTRVRYVSSEEFTNEFINSIRDDKASMFQRRYRDVDILLVDDIQFLSGKVQTQEEFFHTFNTLHNANKQIVITSDLAPKQLQDFEDRMRSRFEWGLTTDVQPPDLETRIAILRKKSAQERLVAPPEVLEFIATNITNNIRELEGALIRVTAYASLTNEPLTVDLAARVLDDVITDSGPRPITPDTILDATSKLFGFSVEDIRGKSRQRPLVAARQTSMYVFRQLTEMSYPAIAREFGGRDHTTVIHAVDKVEALMKERRQVFDQVTELIRMIRNDE